MSLRHISVCAISAALAWCQSSAVFALDRVPPAAEHTECYIQATYNPTGSYCVITKTCVSKTGNVYTGVLWEAIVPIEMCEAMLEQIHRRHARGFSTPILYIEDDADLLPDHVQPHIPPPRPPGAWADLLG